METRKIDPLETKEYRMPTEVYFGRGQIDILRDVINERSYTRYLFVTGEHFVRESSNQELIESLQNTERVSFYPSHIKKSSFLEVNQLTSYAKEGGFDAIVGLGGGVVLDSSKAAAVLVVNGGKVEDYVVDNSRTISRKGVHFIAIPTTSGTGSEVTPWSVIWGNRKYSLSSSEYMFPDIAIVDPSLTDNCPEYVTATSGIDALCQSIEAYWNVNHNSISDKFALESIEVILKNLELAVKNPTEEARDNMAWGSLRGGLAFSNTSTTICHSVSYPMTAHWGISHGQATSITLPIFIDYIFGELGGREKAVLDSFGVQSKEEASEKVSILMRSIGLKTRLSELGIPREGIDIIVQEGFDPSRAKNSPKIPSADELQEILNSIY